MRKSRWLLAAALLMGLSTSVSAGQISGEYIEARTCDVYTGPCFANGEIGSGGKEAVMAWKVDEGHWDGVKLDGLAVALVVKADNTLSFGGSFLGAPKKIASVVIVDSKADATQSKALVSFVKSNAKHLTKDVIKIESAPITLENDHLTCQGVLKAGNLASIETRKLKGGDCVCTNEVVFYPPLTKVENSHAAYTLDMSFSGKGLDCNWNTINKRSAFLGTFSL